MMVCPRCERIIRHGDMVRASILGEFVRVDTEGHSIVGYDEEWMEHVSCVPVSREEKAAKWVRRKVRWLREFIFRAKWVA
jgi:hypothetical protein